MKPILFSTPMVRAIREGRKTQTRRVIKGDIYPGWDMKQQCPSYIRERDGKLYGKPVACRYPPGTVLWVRETWAPCATIDSWIDEVNLYIYKTDFAKQDVTWKWRPSIHMPRDAARLFLKVEKVRLERLQEITPEDIVAEGLPSFIISPGHEHYSNVCGKNWLGYGWYRELWDSLYAKRGYTWASNPWVWLIEFEKVDKP